MSSWFLALGPFVAQTEQKEIIVFIENWKEIGTWFWLNWIAWWLFFISAIFRGKIEVKIERKTQTLGTSCLYKTHFFQNALNGICATMRTNGGQNFSPIWHCLLEVLPQSPPKCLFFCLILQEFCNFSGTWYFRYLIFLRM